MSQIIGWGCYVLLIGILNKLNGRIIDFPIILNLLSTFFIGITSSHLYRNIIVKYDWLKLNLPRLIPHVLATSILMATCFYFLHSVISEILIADKRAVRFEFLEVFNAIINLTANYILWTLFYWLFHFIENYKKEEIKNLKWQAAKNEIELNKLKSQLNPHFIFNSMNSIRALVEDHPTKAKESITQLSNILRNSLLMGKKRFISFEEELNLVNDYLALEKTRFEERLTVLFDIDEGVKGHKVPPLMIQTLVENAIKHGISTIPKGGEVSVIAKLKENFLDISIENSGHYDVVSAEKSAGFGLKNTLQRLSLLYGKEVTFKIENIQNNKVRVHIELPLTVKKSKFKFREPKLI